MINKYKFKLIFFIGEIISFIASKDYIIEFDGKSNSMLKVENENEKAKITINLSQIPPYTKLVVTGSENINYVISAFSNDKREIRIQLTQTLYNKTILFLTQEQVKSQKIYVDVECSSLPCSYHLIIFPQEKINLVENEQLYYYVNEGNKNIDFSIDLFSEKANIWSRGGRLIENNLSKYIKKSQNENYFLVSDKKIEFTVTGTVGDIINVGSNGYNNERSNKAIIVDEDIITVFLSRSYFPQACFNFMLREEVIQKYMIFVEGIIHTKVLKMFTLKEENQTNINLFTNGKFSEVFTINDLKTIEFCFTFPSVEEYPQYNNIEEIIFNFYFTLGKTTKYGLNFFEPQINGQLYERNLLRGEKVAYIGLKPEKKYKEINYNIFAREGFPNMTIYDCDNYPLCLYKKETLYNGISPRNIDDFTTYSTYITEDELENNAISKKQKLLVVECNPSEQVIDIFCKYDTLIYSNMDEINIFEDNYFNQYLLEEEIDNFKINFARESNIKRVNIEIILYVGDIEIITNSNDENVYNRHHNSNKYVIFIDLGKESENLEDMIFKVKAKKNSYYTVLISFVRDNIDSPIINKINSGLNYLVTIDPINKDKDENAKAIIRTKNDKINELLPFMVNFNSINCELSVYKKSIINDKENYTNIDKFENYAEDILTWVDSDDRYYDDFYEYKIYVEKEDFSSYNGKLCMLYISSIEINKQHEIYSRDIVIPDNIQQKIKFIRPIRHISYSYVQVDNKDDLIIQFNVIHKAKYIIKFFYENKEGKNYTISSNNDIYLSHLEWEKECPEKDELCYIIIDITLEQTIEVNDPFLELTVKSVSADTIVYIPKNILKIDYTQNKVIQRYYTEVGKNEIGFILANFYLSSGKIFARLVKKDSVVIEDGEDWEGRYRFPKTAEESLPFDSFTKKINFNTKELDCENGCYLLISLLSNEETIEKIRNHQFYIIIQSTPSNITNEKIPPIRIPTEEYIIGNIDILTDNNIKNFYTILIENDADKVVINLQSEATGMLINIGNENPTLEKADFKFLPAGKDSIINLSKNNIISKIKEKDSNFDKDNIQNIFLTFGLFANSIDSVYTTVYSLMVHLESNFISKINRVKPNRKILCDTEENSNDTNYNYNCLYIIEYKFIGELNNLLIYPNVLDKSAEYQIYADYIDPSIYEIGSQSDIENKIPTNNSEFSSSKTKLKYLFLPDGLINEKYLLINIVTTKKTRIELMSSFYSFFDLIKPNPINSQLFIVRENNLLTLDFEEEKILKANLVSIKGYAEIYWEDNNNKQYLQGEDNRLTLTSVKSNKKKLIVKTINENKENNFNFMFYLTYTLKNQQNIDDLILGKSVNYIYSESDFPIILYSRLEIFDKDIDIFFTFYELENKDNNAFYNEAPIKARVTLVKEKVINDIKSNIDNTDATVDFSNSVKFIYDSAFKSGFIRLTKSQIKKFNINENDKPNIYIKLEKNFETQVFKRLNVEITTNIEDNLISLKEKVYQYGILLENEDKKEYKLKTELNHNYTILEFSSSDELTFNLTNESENKSLEKIFEKSKNGKKIIMFKVNSESNIKLIIYKNKKANNAQNFCFMYYNIEDDKNYKDYIIENDEINVERKKSNNKGINYKILLNSITNSNNLNINYIVKIVTNENKSIPKTQSIVLLEGQKEFVKEFKNVAPNNNKINLELNDVEGMPTYIQVVAHIYDKSINEFLSYKYYELPQNELDEESSNIALIVIIIIIIVLIIIILVVVIFIIKRKKNKDLINDINKIEGQKGLLGNNEKKEYELSNTD